MIRAEYYSSLEKILKEHIKLPIHIEFFTNRKWYAIDKIPSVITNEGEYRIYYCIGDIEGIIVDKCFDKLYSCIIPYETPNEVDYRESDLWISLNNIKYMILNEFQKNFFN